ncbi:glycosyltransferase [Flavobacterium flevense]|nr:glycosyltransferase [Flavobacterium flevense]
MISVIICSRKKVINEVFITNIENTIGYIYELIIIDNSENKYSIFEAYNLGIEKSTGDYWCFIHDDILFHTVGWGEVVRSVFEQDNKIGLIGIAGAKLKTKMPSAWWDCPEQFKIINIIQHFKFGKVKHLQQGWNENNIEEVVVVDGVFMAARRIDKMRFSDSLKGFHNYDLNLSFGYKKQGYRIVVNKEILIEHFSKGVLNASWCQSAVKIHDLYSEILPFQLNNHSENIRGLEFKNGSKFITFSLGHIDRKVIMRYWVRLIGIKTISKFHLKFLRILFNKC